MELQRPKSGQRLALIAALAGLALKAHAMQDALRIVTGEDDSCSTVCLNRGKVFCGRTDFRAGYCCSAVDGCDAKVMEEAPLCSNSVDDPMLKYFVCPKVTSCGEKVIKAKAGEHIDISINPFETFMAAGDKCSYMLQVESYEEGDMIELSAIDSVRTDLFLYHGGYSLASAAKKTKLQNGKQYKIDGSQNLFLIAATNDIGQFGKPYFSLAVKKVPDSAPVVSSDVIDELEDATILAQTVSVDPLVINVETSSTHVQTAEIYASKVQEREEYNSKMETLDVALVSIMWACLGVALVISLTICGLISCKRVLMKQIKGSSEHQVVPTTTRTETLETFPDQHAIQINDLKEVKRVNGSQQSRNALNARRVTNDGRKLTELGEDFAEAQEDDDRMNAFNTEDALKQEVNPTHAVDPTNYMESARGEQLNSSRAFVQKKQRGAPAEYRFSTPGGRSLNKDNEFDHNKENSASPQKECKDFVANDASAKINESKNAASRIDSSLTKQMSVTAHSLEIENGSESDKTKNSKKRRKNKKLVQPFNESKNKNIYDNSDVV